jgi:predicted ATPase/class 3 adenylate cyclase
MSEEAQRIPTPDEYARTPAAGRSPKGERRVVTILFSDVKGSSAMAEALDPEDWAEVMGGAFEHLVNPVQRYGGTVARMMGDAILAFFGAPDAHEDDPQRAVLAGLEILRELGPFCEQVRRQHGLEFSVRVGINTGPVVVGDIGSNLAMEYTAMGDAVNVAAYMEQTAQPGTVQVAEATHRIVAPLFDFEDLGLIQVKGKREPVHAYRALAPKAEPGRLRGIEGLTSPLVGRQREQAALRQVLQDLDHGRGGIVLLLGDAGLGKSRLVEEVRREWEARPDQPGRWLQAGGISYDMARPYSLFQQLFRTLCNISEHDEPAQARERILDLCADFQEEVNAQAGRAAELVLSLHRQKGTAAPEGEALKRELFATMLTAWRKPARLPLVMALDDLHWADPASVELLQHLFQLADEIPILFLCAMRPYRQSPGWAARTAAETSYPHRFTEIELQPLSAQESDSLVDHLLRIADLPAELRSTIQDKSEGNPFFVEEIIRTLIEAGAIERDEQGQHWRTTRTIEAIALPDNLQALLISRMDRLEKDVRRTLQLASVIGRSFFYRVLEWIAEMQDTLQPHLNTLQRVELIREVARVPEWEFIFRHDLTRDAAYHSILKRERREYHRKVGQAIEALFPDRLDEEAHRLAYHFREAGEPGRALHYYLQAGDAAARLYANQEAITQYGRGIEIAQRDSASDEQLIHLYTKLGRTYEVCGQFDQALETYAELEKLGVDRGQPALELAALLPQATVLATPTGRWDTERAEVIGKRALSLAQQLGDARSESKALWNLMLLENYADRNQPLAVEYGERALDIARRNDLPEERAFALHDLARAYIQGGQLSQGVAAYEESRQLWRQLNNLPLLADNLSSAALPQFYLGNYRQALDLAREGLEISRYIENLWGQAYGLMALGPIHAELGEVGEAVRALEECIRFVEKANFVGAAAFGPPYLAWIYANLGTPQRGLDLVEANLARLEGQEPRARIFTQAIRDLIRNRLDAGPSAAPAGPSEPFVERPFPDPIFDGLAAVLQGEVALAQGNPEKALAVSERGLENMARAQVKPLRPQLHLHRGEALRFLGQVEAARDAMRQGRELAAALGSRWSLMDLTIHLWDLERAVGDPPTAEALAGEARALIAEIAGNIPDEDLKRAFLAKPGIRELLA